MTNISINTWRRLSFNAWQWSLPCLDPHEGSRRYLQHRCVGRAGWPALWHSQDRPSRASASSSVRFKNYPGRPPGSFLHLHDLACVFTNSTSTEGMMLSENRPLVELRGTSQGTPTPHFTLDKLKSKGAWNHIPVCTSRLIFPGSITLTWPLLQR